MAGIDSQLSPPVPVPTFNLRFVYVLSLIVGECKIRQSFDLEHYKCTSELHMCERLVHGSHQAICLWILKLCIY